MRIKITLFLVFFFFTATLLVAQPSDPNIDPDVPITGLEILIAIGGALGIRKLLNNRRGRTS